MLMDVVAWHTSYSLMEHIMGGAPPFTQALPGNAFREAVMLDSFVQCQVDRRDMPIQICHGRV